MKHMTLIALGLVFASTIAEAQVATFTNSTDFHAANPTVTLIENFEDSDPAFRDISLPSYTGPGGEITFTPISSTPLPPNVWLASPGYTDEGAGPNTSVILTVTGNEDFVGTLSGPTDALGFDVFLNDWPATLSFFNGNTLLATLTFDTPPEPGNNVAFAGIFSTQGVTSFHWQATNGQYLDTAIDNIYAGPLSGVPEPATWAMMLLGFGTVGFAMRRRKPTQTPLAHPLCPKCEPGGECLSGYGRQPPRSAPDSEHLQVAKAPPRSVIGQSSAVAVDQARPQ
jgi:hypothetical protein